MMPTDRNGQSNEEVLEEDILNERLQNLVDAEAAKKAGKIPKDPILASMSLEQIQREIQTVSLALAKALGLEPDEGAGMADYLRAEAMPAMSTAQSNHAVVTRVKELQGDLKRTAYVALVFIGLFSLAAGAALLNREWAVFVGLAVCAGLCFLRSRVGVRFLRVETGGRILVREGNDWEPIDLTKYSYVRSVYESVIWRIPSMIIFQQRPIYPIATAMLGRLFPHQSKHRLVLFINSCWRDQQGRLISSGAMDQLFHEAAKKAGYQIEMIGNELTRGPGWAGKRN